MRYVMAIVLAIILGFANFSYALELREDLRNVAYDKKAINFAQRSKGVDTSNLLSKDITTGYPLEIENLQFFLPPPSSPPEISLEVVLHVRFYKPFSMRASSLHWVGLNGDGGLIRLPLKSKSLGVHPSPKRPVKYEYSFSEQVYQLSFGINAGTETPNLKQMFWCFELYDQSSARGNCVSGPSLSAAQKLAIQRESEILADRANEIRELVSRSDSSMEDCQAVGRLMPELLTAQITCRQLCSTKPAAVTRPSESRLVQQECEQRCRKLTPEQAALGERAVSACDGYATVPQLCRFLSPFSKICNSSEHENCLAVENYVEAKCSVP